MPAIKAADGGAAFWVKVVPRSSFERLEKDSPETLQVHLCAPPVEGAANAALVAFLAKHWRIPKRSIQLLSGETARVKRLAIEADAALARRITEEIGALAP